MERSDNGKMARLRALRPLVEAGPGELFEVSEAIAVQLESRGLAERARGADISAPLPIKRRKWYES